MKTTPEEHEQLVREFIETLQHRDSPDVLDRFYHPDAKQTEFPNLTTKGIVIRTVSDLKAAAAKGRTLLTKENYQIKKLYSTGDTVIMEAVWTGTLAIPLGSINAGGQLKAYFAQIFEFNDGKIYRQRNYDCFEPFE